ncbi:hypothetical protein M231_01960 [Tremella mesenterica]|uniref:DUF6534 domain-containing protein n=1 Tax=Tremella mesenterica TaxID=5217 RepID=A0A4Q1BRV7_TREME|nr:hypothetical protein M231_01960 [Tremella mesenterica]
MTSAAISAAMSDKDLSSVIAPVTGPFFLGFALESFGMGVVLVLSINYFSDVSNRHGGYTGNRLGVALVSSSLVINLLQTTVDLVRGWQMFGDNFLNIQALMKPTPLFFISPFLGLFPALITQAFLLRRTVLFISSLDVLWPRLSKPYVTRSFVVLVGCMILMSFIAGSVGSVLVWTTGRLYDLHTSEFDTSEMITLAVSTAVDMLLSTALCCELWWARRKLAPQGGLMREVVTRVILITLHGGLAASALQLAGLLTFKSSRTTSMCYLPILPLPKVYTVTLILSLTHPTSTMAHSRPITLPTIQQTDYLSQPAPFASGLSRRMSSPAVIGPMSEKPWRAPWTENDHHKATSDPGRAIRRQWKRSQEWLRWSLIGTSSEPRPRGSDRVEDWTNLQREIIIPNGDYDYSRRPSEPTSAAPLLRRTSVPSTQPPQSPSSFRKNHHIHKTMPSAPPSMLTVSRQHSFSSFYPSLSIRRPSFPISAISPPSEVSSAEPLFRTTDPFSNFRALHPGAWDHIFGSPNPISPLTPTNTNSSTSRGRDRRGAEMSESRESEERREGRQARMLSFEDMLSDDGLG